ncbi:hypothetical protein AB0O07_28870 [Streptomyces sp. NPDC093085]|uniref:hypothetical protein n=1 Tax=Streptomyces sp. NPDC093085 TaxID=3155068 RepID=UPI00341F94D0
MRARAMVTAAMSVCVALGVGGCGPEKGGAGGAGDGASPSGDVSASAAPSAAASSEAPPAEPTGEQPGVQSKEGAIKRYEEYLRALGHEDIDTVCDIAGPAAKKAEDQGFGPCTSTFRFTFQMISPAQKTALKTATVDPGQVVEGASGKIDIPKEAIKAPATFGEDELGDSTLEYLKNNWYITG